MLAVSINGLALEFVQHQTYEICKAAFANNKDSRHFINEEFRAQFKTPDEYILR